jgi:hypothetical protein
MSKDKAGAGQCPVDCEGEPMSRIHPGECVDCGACESRPARPRRSSPKTTSPASGRSSAPRTPGFSGQLGSPGGTAKTGPLPHDTGYLASYITSW